MTNTYMDLTIIEHINYKRNRVSNMIIVMTITTIMSHIMRWILIGISMMISSRIILWEVVILATIMAKDKDLENTEIVATLGGTQLD
jgi:hypothetical protein